MADSAGIDKTAIPIPGQDLRRQPWVFIGKQEPEHQGE